LATLLLIGRGAGIWPVIGGGDCAPLLSTNGARWRWITAMTRMSITKCAGSCSPPLQSFVGEWVLVIDNVTTDHGRLDNHYEVAESSTASCPFLATGWKLRGALLPDGRLEARKVRPDDFEANQVIVRLKAGADPVQRWRQAMR
jgi:hypothetical protein